MTIGSQITLSPIPHASTNEKIIVGRLVGDVLAAGYSVSIFNGGEDAEVERATDPAVIFAELSASDRDELVLYKDGVRGGWVLLIWGNDVDVISDYSIKLETVLSGANALAQELDR